MRDLESERLQDRIWRSFPVAQPAFAKLLSLLEIEATRTVPSAEVSLGVRSSLRINPDFAAAHCGSDAALVMLVMHELFHVVLGHTRLYRRSTPALNFAFDAVINAQLCLLFPDPQWTRLFRELYRPGAIPWALLRPPEGWRTPEARWLPGSVGALHRSLYTDESLSYEDLFRMLAEAAEKAGGASRQQVVLLGNHDGAPDDAGDPGLLAEIREIIADWPMVEQRSGRDQGGRERAFRVERRGRGRAAATLRLALCSLRDRHGDGAGRPRTELTSVTGSFPHRAGGDRRAAVLEACGIEPLLFAGQLSHLGVRRGEQVHVYLDVSGSMDGLVAPLYAALAQLTDWMTPMLHLFSTTVKDITRDELKRGQGASTGGTDISVVTGHMVRHDVRRALIITDGWVGDVPGEHARQLAGRKGRFGVALTPGGDPAFAKGLRARVWQLPDLHQEQP